MFLGRGSSKDFLALMGPPVDRLKSCALLFQGKKLDNQGTGGGLFELLPHQNTYNYIYMIYREHMYIYIYRIIYSTQLPKRLKAPTSALTNQDLSTTSIGARVQPLSWKLIHSLRMLLFVLIA